MNSNLNPQLFDPGPALPREKKPPPDQERGGRYVSPHPAHGGSWGVYDDWELGNPIFSRSALRDTEASSADIWAAEKSRAATKKDQWVATADLVGDQKDYYPPAVDSLVEGTTGLEVPNVEVARLGGRDILLDGNHRVNAALRRGQMIVPANVLNVDQWREEPEWD